MVIPLPSVSYLQECFDVDFLNGTLTWKLRPQSHFDTLKAWRIHTKKCCGKRADCPEPRGYRSVKLCGKNIKAHRILFKMYHEYEPEQIDHHNRNRSDNSISNLRPSSYAENSRNHKKQERDLPTGVHYRETGGARFIAAWRERNGKQSTRSFSIKQHGHDKAFQLACDYRAKMIAELNEQGAGYSETHGL